MPFSVEQLLTDRHKPLSVRPTDKLVMAIDLMNEYDYSQLPVVDADSKPIGLVCSDTIVNALRQFQVSPNHLQVSDAMIRAVTKHDNAELFDLLDALQNTYAVLIVNNKGELAGIVTSYDTTDYFRRQTQDLMFVQDIELMLRDFVSIHLSSSNEKNNTESSNGRIITNTKAVEQMTFNEIIQIFLSKDIWAHYGNMFSLQSEAIQQLLDSVRKTRNKLMHLQEISYEQHEQLRFCKDWITRYHSQLATTTELTTPGIPEIIVNPEIALPLLVDEIEKHQLTTSVGEDEPQPNASRYDHLARWLRSQSRSTDRVQLSFVKVEKIIDSELPDSARKHRAWWANDSHTHVQSMSWLAADWRVSSINMDKELVTFSRIHDREQAYINFFSRLINELKQPDDRFLEMSPNGSSWITVAKLKIQQRSIGMYNALFTRNGLFRLELYIDTEDKALNSALYEALQLIYAPRITEINEKLGTPLEWDSMPGRRGVRIAVSHSGSITAKSDELEHVRSWGVKTMVLFYQIFADASQLLEKHYQDGKSPALAPLFSQG
ncbi:DUF4268 domain-containing protein [Herpetosiphon sp. NSE202]|uniref:DUF4268 domain-containing protein n=1 Tax=Herpetosiphon sp. NSE202 TaxID=3351349 RepID=UPI00362FC965